MRRASFSQRMARTTRQNAVALGRASLLYRHEQRARMRVLAKVFRLLLPKAMSSLSLPPPPHTYTPLQHTPTPVPRTQRVPWLRKPLTSIDRQRVATVRQQAATAPGLRATNHFNSMALFASHTGVAFADPSGSDPMEMVVSRGLLSPYMPSILGPYPPTHTHFPLTVAPPQLIGIIVSIRKRLRHTASLARNTASLVSHTGEGALAHARVVTVTPLSGVHLFTIVNLIRQEDPYSDST